MRIAWFSDFSTKDFSSKSAYFSHLVLPSLVLNNEIDNYGTELEVEDFKVQSFKSAVSNHRKNPYDAFVYQIENNAKLEFVSKLLELMPGVVIIHDLNCSNFYTQKYALSHSQKNSLVPQILSELSNLDVTDPLLNKFYLEPYTRSLIRIFINPRTYAEWNNLCSKQNIFGVQIKDNHSYVIPCLEAFAGGKQEHLQIIADKLQEILVTNESYLKTSLAKWERYTFYRSNS